MRSSSERAEGATAERAAIRVGVIGCGLQGQAHCAELAAIEGVELAAVADLDEQRLAEVGERFAVGQRCSDAARLLELGLDLVSICTMPNTHRELAVGALERGSHVLCEKPLARSAAEGAEIVRAAERTGRLLMVGFNMRYMGATAAVRRFMDEGLLGDLVCARGFMLADDVPG
ncbi:MAG: Gfo/Idh/MocA family oxidoreductase, partial [Conexibacter sp.]